MNISKEQIKALNPCDDGYKWYLDNGTSDLLETLLKANLVNDEWCSWLYTKLMTHTQQKQFAIYAAERVLNIFEDKYPNDKRPGKAIEAAKKALELNTEATRDATYFQACNAHSPAGHAAYAAYAAVEVLNRYYLATCWTRETVKAAKLAAGAHSIVVQEDLIKRAVDILETV